MYVQHQVVKEDFKAVKCSHCDRNFVDKHVLRHHLINSHEIGKYPCNLCSSVFPYRFRLKTHLNNVHTKYGSNVECEYCHKTFKFKENVKRHIRLVHQKIKRFKCEWCYKAFASKSILHVHKINAHGQKDDRRISCSTCICNKIFKSITGFKWHLKTHEKPDKAEVLKCDICEKNFPLKTELKAHYISLHGFKIEHKCDLCSNSYNRLPTLQRHKNDIHDKIDSNLRKCNICEKTFTSSRSKERLKRHMKDVHSEVKLNCKICNNEFKSKSTMEKHMKKLHLIAKKTV